MREKALLRGLAEQAGENSKHRNGQVDAEHGDERDGRDAHEQNLERLVSSLSGSEKRNDEAAIVHERQCVEIERSHDGAYYD